MQSIKILFHMSQNAFLIYGTCWLTKLCDLSSNPEQSFYYIIEDKKINRSSWMWLVVAAASTACIHIESVPSSIGVWARLSFTSLITHGAGRLEDLASGALRWHMLT